MSNFDIMNWVKELKIKYIDGVFSKDSRQWAYNCGIINLDSNNGPGTHSVCSCSVNSFYLIPLDYHHPKIFFLSNDTILHNIKIKISVLCGCFCLFFFQDGNSIYNILYKF